MKIAIVVPGGLHPSGREQVVPSWLALFERLAEAHTIHAFALKHLPDPRTYTLKGFTVHDLGRPSAPLGFTRLAQERALSRALAETGPFNLIHGFHADPAGQLAARAGRRLKIPSIVTCDSGEFISIPSINYGSQRTRSGKTAVREACTLATKVHVCTPYMGALAAGRSVATTVIPLTSVTSEAATMRPALRPETDPFRIVQVASLSRVKNQRLLIDALSILRTKVDAHVDLVGEDTLNGELQQHAESIGVGAHVTFHGFLPQEHVIDILSRADLYVQSSLHEAAGVADWSPAKAMALGDPTPASMADAIVALHGDPVRRQSLAAAARSFSIAHDATWVAAQFDRVYRGLRF